MENSCLKKYKPSSKNWISASRHTGFRRNSALIPANAGLFHYAGNNPVRYIDPDGREDSLDWINQYVPSEYRESVKEFMVGKKIVKGGTLSIKQISAILFNETRSLSGEKVNQARKEIAHAIINADKKWGDKRTKYAKSAPEKANVPDAEINTYKACLEAAIEAIKEDEKGEDPTNNALYFNFRITDSKKDRGGTKVHTSTGPLDNSYSKYKYANTYGE